MDEFIELFIFSGNIIALLACLLLAPRTFFFYIVILGVVAWTCLTLPNDVIVWINQSLGWVRRCSWYRFLEAAVSDLTAEIHREWGHFLEDTPQVSDVQPARHIPVRVAPSTRPLQATAAQPTINARVEVPPSGTNPPGNSRSPAIEGDHLERSNVPCSSCGRGVLPGDLPQMRALESRIRDLRHTLSRQLRELDTSLPRSRHGRHVSPSSNRPNVSPSRNTTGSVELSDMGLETAFPASSLAHSSPHNATQATLSWTDRAQESSAPEGNQSTLASAADLGMDINSPADDVPLFRPPTPWSSPALPIAGDDSMFTPSALELLGELRPTVNRSTRPGQSRTNSRSAPAAPRNRTLHTAGSVPHASARNRVDFSDSTSIFSTGLANTGRFSQSHRSRGISHSSRETPAGAATHAGPDPPSTGDSRALIGNQETLSRPRQDIGRESATARRRIYGQRVARMFASSFRNNRRTGLTTGLTLGAHSGNNWSTLGSAVPRTNRLSSNSRSVPHTGLGIEIRQRTRPLSAVPSTLDWTEWIVTPSRPSRVYFLTQNEPNPDALSGSGTTNPQRRRTHTDAANEFHGRTERNHTVPSENPNRRASRSTNGTDPQNAGLRFSVPARILNGRPSTNSDRSTNVLPRETQAVNPSTLRTNGASSHANRASSLANGASYLTNGAPSLSNGASSLANRASSRVNGASSLSNGASSLSNGASSLANGASSLANGASSRVNAASSLVNGASSLANGAPPLANGASPQTNAEDRRSNGASGRIRGTAPFQRRSLGSHLAVDHSGSSVSLSPVISSDFEHFRSAMEAEREKRKCVVCKDKRKSVLVMPCKHLCMCSSCGQRISQAEDRSQRVCPLCRANILTTFRVYV